MSCGDDLVAITVTPHTISVKCATSIARNTIVSALDDALKTKFASDENWVNGYYSPKKFGGLFMPKRFWKHDPSIVKRKLFSGGGTRDTRDTSEESVKDALKSLHQLKYYGKHYITDDGNDGNDQYCVYLFSYAQNLGL